MRQTFIMIALATLCGLAYVACDQSEIGATDPKSSSLNGKELPGTVLSLSSPTALSPSPLTVQNVGAIHNQGLTYVRGEYDHAIDFRSTREQAAHILSLTAAYFRSTMGWDSALVITPQSQEALTSMLDRRYPASDLELWGRMKTEPQFRTNVAAGDVALIDEALAVFSLPSSGMTNEQVAGRIIARADSLSVTAWGGRGDSKGGELSKSFLSLMKGSAAHWRDHPVATTELSGPAPELGQLVQIDCVGYLLGWWSALTAEISSNGRADINNQYKRIGAGAAAAISWSMGGPVRKYFGG